MRMNKTTVHDECFLYTTLFISIQHSKYTGNVVLRVRLSARVRKRCPEGTESYVQYGLITLYYLYIKVATWPVKHAAC